MEYIGMYDSMIVIYEYQGKEIEIEWVSSHFLNVPCSHL